MTFRGRNMIPLEKGLIVELDYTAPGGLQFMFDTLRKTLSSIDPKLVAPTAVDEARYFAGRDCEAALGDYFSRHKCKKTAPKAARDLAAAMQAAFTKKLPSLVTQPVKNFIRAVAESGVRTVLVTCADVADSAIAAFAAQLPGGDRVSVVHEDMTRYGGISGGAVKRVVNLLRIHPSRLVLVAGSGHSVKECLKYGIGSMAVSCRRNEYQDFSGVGTIVGELGTPAARKAMAMLRVCPA